MAMVFRSKKTLDIPIDNEKIYNNNHLKNKKIIKRLINSRLYNKSSNFLTQSIKNKHIAFGSSSEKKQLYINNYGHNLFNLNYDNINKDNFNSDFNSFKTINKDNPINIFISKEKRFKLDNYENNAPGPGHYFKDKKNRDNKKNFLFRKYNSFHKTFSTDKFPSIPLNNSNINLNIDIIHNSINSINNNEKILKNKKVNKSTNVSFLNKNIKNNIEEINNDSQIESNIFYSNNSTSLTINNSLNILNFKKNDKAELDKYFYIDKNTKHLQLTNNKINNNNYLTRNINGKNYLNNIHKKLNLNIDTPITNQCNNYLTFNTLSIKTKDNKYQNFGSSTIRNVFSLNKRFNINNIIPISDKKPKMIKSKSFTKKGNEFGHKQLFNKKIINKSKENLINDNYIYKENILKDNIRPRKNELFNKNLLSNKIQNFGSLEVRFPMTLSETITPGVGKYLGLEIWGNKKKYNNSFIPKIIKKDNIQKNNNFKILFNKLLKNEKNKIPSVGQYSPEKFVSIEHDNKKFNKKNSSNILNNEFKKNKDIFKSLNNSKEKKINTFDHREIGLKKQKVPFLSTENRKGFEEMEIKDINYIVGPGFYLDDSYFDWNKKSYNLLYN